MSAPVDPSLERMQQSMTAAHRLALDAVCVAKTAGMRDGINACADIIDTATKADLPAEFVTELENIRDAIRLLAYQITDPAPIEECGA